MLLVWYPATGEPQHRGAWIPAAWADSAASDLHALSRRAVAQPSLDQVRRTLRETSSWSRDSSEVATAGAPFPVLVFSPGNVTIPAYYATLAEEMASWGYIVVGHVPTGYSRNVVLPDGRVFPRRSYRDLDPWVGDLRTIVGQLSAWNRDPDHPLHGRIDTLRVGIYGHSGGANAAEMITASDARVRALVALDPGVTPDSCATAKPTLLLLADIRGLMALHPQDANDMVHERAAFMRKLSQGYQVTILGSEHMSFTDLPSVPDLRTSSESPAQLIAARQVLLGFFQEVFRGIPCPLLHGGAVDDSLLRVRAG
jgi:dienelactone hydrolase